MEFRIRPRLWKQDDYVLTHSFGGDSIPPLLSLMTRDHVFTMFDQIGKTVSTTRNASPEPYIQRRSLQPINASYSSYRGCPSVINSRGKILSLSLSLISQVEVFGRIVSQDLK